MWVKRITIAVILLIMGFQASTQNIALLKGNIQGTQEGDSIILYVWNKLIIAYSIESKLKSPNQYSSYTVNSKNGDFNIPGIKVDNPSYFSMAVKKKHGNELTYFIQDYILKAGDSIDLKITNKRFNSEREKSEAARHSNLYSISASGKGSIRINCCFEVNSIISPENVTTGFKKSDLPPEKQEIAHMNFVIDKWNDSRIKAFSILESYIGKSDSSILTLIQDDVIGKTSWQMMYAYSPTSYFEPDNSLKRIELNKIYTQKLKSNNHYLRSDSIISPFLSHYINYKIYNDLKFQSKKLSYPDVYQEIKSKYYSRQRDYLILHAFYLWGDLFKLEVIRDMVATVKDKYSHSELHSTVRSIMTGSRFFDFSLQDQSGNTHSLSSLKGKVFFIDFWFTGCGGCSAFYNNVLKKVEEKYRNNKNIEFISVSIDKDKATWIRSLQAGSYTGDDAINLYTNGEGSLHPIIDNYGISAYPSPFLVDADGNLFQRGIELLSEKKLVESIEAALARPSFMLK